MLVGAFLFLPAAGTRWFSVWHNEDCFSLPWLVHDRRNRNITKCLLQVCLFLFYALATSKVISGPVPICDSVPSLWLCSVTALGDQAARTRTWYPTQSHYPDTELTSPCPITVMPNAGLSSDKYQFCRCLVWLDQEINSQLLHRKPALYQFGHCVCSCCQLFVLAAIIVLVYCAFVCIKFC